MQCSTPESHAPHGITLHHATAGLHQVSPDADQRACHRCGAIDQPALGPGAGPHYASARCRHCGAWLRWLSQYTPAARQTRRQQARQQAMAQRPPSQLQLAYLEALGDDPGSPPATMAEASERIDTLVRREVTR